MPVSIKRTIVAGMILMPATVAIVWFLVRPSPASSLLGCLRYQRCSGITAQSGDQTIDSATLIKVLSSDVLKPASAKLERVSWLDEGNGLFILVGAFGDTVEGLPVPAISGDQTRVNFGILISKLLTIRVLGEKREIATLGEINTEIAPLFEQLIPDLQEAGLKSFDFDGVTRIQLTDVPETFRRTGRLNADRPRRVFRP